MLSSSLSVSLMQAFRNRRSTGYRHCGERLGRFDNIWVARLEYLRIAGPQHSWFFGFQTGGNAFCQDSGEVVNS